MRKISVRTVQKFAGANETLVLLVPSNVSELTSEEYSRLIESLRKVDFLRSYSSRLTIRLAVWDAIEAAFESERVRLIPDDKKPVEKYADILFSIGEEDEQ
nr:MAG TPA: hypothetical protein [Caudoviricetes sp.]